MRRAFACLLAGGLLLAAGCSDDAPSTEGTASQVPAPVVKVVDCGLTQPQRGQAQAYAQVRLTNTGDAAARIRVRVRFVAGGAVLGVAEASTEELDGGQSAGLNVIGADGATRAPRCEVAEVTRF